VVASFLTSILSLFSHYDHLLCCQITHLPCSFGNLYGPPKSSGGNSIKSNENWYSPDDTSSSASIASSSAATESSSGAECAANSKCKALGLIGACCPTHDGVMLGCCD
jgi:hypothetical protein